MTAGLGLVAATSHAAPRSDVVVMRAAPQPANLVTAPQVALDTQAPTDTQVPDDQTLQSLVAEHATDIASIDPETECMAKVVQHEAGNQPLQGQLAVAEVVINRTKSPRFPSTPCAVVNQRGQFFHIATYRVSRTSERWRTAVAVARVAEAGELAPVAPGALFFHATYSRYDWSHRHAFVTRIADQIFYR